MIARTPTVELSSPHTGFKAQLRKHRTNHGISGHVIHVQLWCCLGTTSNRRWEGGTTISCLSVATRSTVLDLPNYLISGKYQKDAKNARYDETPLILGRNEIFGTQDRRRAEFMCSTRVSNKRETQNYCCQALDLWILMHLISWQRRKEQCRITRSNMYMNNCFGYQSFQSPYERNKDAQTNIFLKHEVLLYGIQPPH